MKTQVLRTTNGNLVAMINGVETFISQDGKRWNKVETSCFDKIFSPKNVVEVEATEPPQVYNEYMAHIKAIEDEQQRQRDEYKRYYDSTSLVQNCGVNGSKIQLRSDGRLYRHDKNCGWRPLAETTKTAVRARIEYNLPLDRSEMTQDDLIIIEEHEKSIKEEIEWVSNSNNKIIEDYNELHMPIKATYENICKVLRYLHLSYWGTWELPPMTIGYKALQYDCDGVTASTIILDKPISDDEANIRNERKFKIGGKHGYLNSYQGIR